ncbi:hypothetical protein AAFF_G00247630 [Aldrovandia affinis]|uniref:Uncharacterized protein n=1 Tax=Aldrovandia affinis TaxID=143900 RepID=A0AAD7WTZ9_9TELE|nr:hypothetical protein AAFF_G00247630 [Aldrovandia affinis]
MAGCTLRCKQGLVKFMQSLRRFLSGTLNKGSCLCSAAGICLVSDLQHQQEIHAQHPRSPWEKSYRQGSEDTDRRQS